MLAQKLMGSSAADTPFVDDVFQTVLRTGTGATATVTAGFQPDLVWIKDRTASNDNMLFDSARGAGYRLYSNATNAHAFNSDTLTSFNTSGFGIGANSNVNTSGNAYVDWAVKKAPKFFDCVAYTGDGVAGRQISHALGVAPGMIIVKRTDSTSNWPTYHRSLSNPSSNAVLLNLTNAALGAGFWTANPTDTVFYLSSDADVNGNGNTYVAYIFAHDTSTDGIIQCGSYTTTGSGSVSVNLGWEPQFLLVKSATYSGADDIRNAWNIADSMRGLTADGWFQDLRANLSNAETTVAYLKPNATGFSSSGNFNAAAGETHIYLAIRRPNKPPTTGTQVYSATTTDNGSFPNVVTGFPVDMGIRRANKGSVQSNLIASRLTGSQYLLTDSTAAELSTTSVRWDSMNGWYDTTLAAPIVWSFRRAPGVMDVVCYTGTGSATTVAHSLGVAPELMIVKRRGATTGNWAVGIPNGAQYRSGLLNSTADLGLVTYASGEFFSSAPTATVIGVGTDATVNAASGTYVAYLFATKAGISKVGSYTGNGGGAQFDGTSQTINCGFTTGARFVMIKRTDNNGDWFVWDTVRGIVAGNDSYLKLNSTAAEVTTDDSIDPDSTGFIVNQLGTTNINATSATYIYLAYA